MLHEVADAVPRSRGADAVRVAVDGVDGAGKTVFADELATVLRSRGRPCVRASVDGFHHLRGVRHRRGRSSPEGFWLDSYDYAALTRELLAPLGPGGDRTIRRAVHDVRAERALDLPQETAPPGAVLVLDGIFLHRDELVGWWDFSVLLEVSLPVSVARLAGRDGSSPDPAAPGNRRYVEGQRHYLATCSPRTRASVVVDNDDLTAPVVTRRRRSASGGR